MRGDRCNPTRSNNAKLIRLAPRVSVACSVIGRSIWLPRISSSTYGACHSVATMILVPHTACSDWLDYSDEVQPQDYPQFGKRSVEALFRRDLPPKDARHQ